VSCCSAITGICAPATKSNVGERVHARLADAGLPLLGLFHVPNSVQTIIPLVGQILVETEARRSQGHITELHLFYNRPTSAAVYAPVHQRLLPLDESWRRQLGELPWPTKDLPEVLGDGSGTLRALAANTCSFRSFGPAPNPLPARTPAAWRRCNGPTKTSTNCWKI
jgi:alternate F1F0 ATPase F1 subunit gamma